ncbi:MAG: hypothetical protein ACRCX2_23070, partial [Paraclostridium sp.]
ITKEVAAIRYPCVNRLEPQRLNLVACDDLWYLKDVLVFNPYDGTWCAMGGADFDGDTCLVVFDKYIIELIKIYKRPFITDIVTHKLGEEKNKDNKDNKDKDSNKGKKINNYEARAYIYETLHKGALVGLYSSMHSKTISRIYHECYGTDVKAFSKSEHIIKSIMWTFVIGKEIDRAKTYENFVVTNEMTQYAKFNPIHLIIDKMVKRGIYDGRAEDEYTGEASLVSSNCPRGQMFRWLQKEYGFYRLNSNTVLNNILQVEGRSDEKSFLDMISKHVSLYNASEIRPYMQHLYENFTAFNSYMAEKYRNADSSNEEVSKERASEYKAKYEYFTEQFEIICNVHSFNKATAAFILAKIPFDLDKANLGKEYTIKDKVTGEELTKVVDKKRSKSCAFRVAGTHLVKLIGMSRDNTVNIEIPDVLDGTEILVKGTSMFINGVEYTYGKLVEGIYTAKTDNRGSYVTVNRDQLILKEQTQSDRITEQKGSISSLEQFRKDMTKKLRLDFQHPFTLSSTKAYNNTPKDVFEKIAGKEFTVGTVEYKGAQQPCMLIEGQPVAGLINCHRALIGRVFTVDANILSTINLYNNTRCSRLYANGRYVKETVLFSAIEIEVDETLVLDDSIVYDDTFRVDEENIVNDSVHYENTTEMEISYDDLENDTCLEYEEDHSFDSYYSDFEDTDFIY